MFNYSDRWLTPGHVVKIDARSIRPEELRPGQVFIIDLKKPFIIDPQKPFSVVPKTRSSR